MGTFAPCPFSSFLESTRRFPKSSLFQNAARFNFPLQGLLDRRHRGNDNMKEKSRVQTSSNLGHFLFL